MVAPHDSSSSYDESDVPDAERSNKNNANIFPKSTNRIRHDSSSEDYIPLAQLRKRLQEQDQEQSAFKNDSEALHN